MHDEPRIGLVAPLPPQVGGVASFAEWIVAHEREIGCRYETFDLWRPPSDEVGGRVTPRAALRQARMLLRFARWTVRAPRIVHYCLSYTPTGLSRDLLFLVLLRLAGRQTIGHVHGFTENVSRARSFALHALGRLTKERVVATPRAGAMLSRLGIRSRVIPNPLRFEPSPNGRVEQGSPFQVLLVGTIGATKGSADLLEALAAIRETGVEAKLRVVGREERRGDAGRFQAIVRARGVEDAVELAGLVSREEMPHEYERAHVLCLPSKREGAPMAILEGMAFGLPVVATRVGGIPDLVEDGVSGLLVSPGDVQALTAALRDLAGDPERRERMGVAGRERVAALASAETVEAGWRDLYMELGAK